MAANEQQQIGALIAEVNNLKDRFDKLEATGDEIRDAVVAARGGWKVLAAVGAISAGVGGLVVKFIPIAFLKP